MHNDDNTCLDCGDELSVHEEAFGRCIHCQCFNDWEDGTLPDPPQHLIIVCAWCGLVLQGSEDAREVSHGICQPCAANWHKEGAPEALDRPLEALRGSVRALTGLGRV